jgi:tripartite-type tricarboxylate transporter receptor subunit TctC
VPGYDASAWAGLGTTRGTPPEIIERLNRELNAGLADPAIKARLADVATTLLVFTAKEFETFVAAEVEKWGKVVRSVGIKAG